MSPPVPILLVCACLVATISDVRGAERPLVILSHSTARLQTGILQRTIDLSDGNVATRSLEIAEHEVLSPGSRDFAVTLSRAEPNRRPAGLKPRTGGAIDSVATFSPGKSIDPAAFDDRKLGLDVQWVDPVTIQSAHWSGVVGSLHRQVSHPRPGITRLCLAAPGHDAAEGVTIRICYELYQDHPVIRKWIELANTGSRWLKLDQLSIDDIVLGSKLASRTLLTPAEYGAESSVVAFATPDDTLGIIAASEVPSALRTIGQHGAMGYRPEYFEWILGPGETFVSEPVFQYAFSGAVEKTASAPSTPLDRALEGSYSDFLHQHVGIAADASPYEAPQWLTWESFFADVSDPMIRQMADRAAKAGFVQFLIDDGWQKGRLGTVPNNARFPDFADTCRYIESRGLKLGLWLSCFRDPDSPDLQKFPNACSVPLVTRLGGYAMSFASPWRDYYIEDLASLHERFGVVYFKQDFSNIIFGDLGEGHENRSRKDSLLRSLRRLLEVQDTLRRKLPEVTTQLTHEIYWNTPGVPCDLAVLKHAARYHVTPNACLGEYISFQDLRSPDKAKVDPARIRQSLLAGCLKARERFYAHRGLPVHCIEFYGAATVNYRGTLTPEIQDRQICSWLMGAPLVFSGDLATLTDENLKRYKDRFGILKQLQKAYGIYQHFQFSGVPGPTDVDWHWWGKLDHEGCGAVVVIRGSGGPEHRPVNIPWVQPERTYRVTARLAGKALGTFTGSQLKSAALDLTLPACGQEILELAETR